MNSFGCLSLIVTLILFWLAGLFLGFGVPVLGLVCACLILRSHWSVAAALATLSCYQLIRVSAEDLKMADIIGGITVPLAVPYYIQLIISVVLMAYGDYGSRRGRFLTHAGVAFAYVSGSTALIVNAIFLAIQLIFFFGR